MRLLVRVRLLCRYKVTSEPTATAARFDKPELAATRKFNGNVKSNFRAPPEEEKAGSRYKIKGKIEGAHPATRDDAPQNQLTKAARDR